MKDTIQTVATDAYSGDTKAIVVGLLVLAGFLFILWFREFIKK